MSNTDKLREIAEKYFPTEEKLSNNSLYNQLQQSSQDNLLSDLAALISEGYYPKKFVEWIFKEGIGSNDDGTLFHYVSIQVEGHPFKELKELTFNTIDELFNYWRENEQ